MPAKSFKKTLHTRKSLAVSLSSDRQVLVWFAVDKYSIYVNMDIIRLLDALHALKLARCIRMRRELHLLQQRYANRSMEVRMRRRLPTALEPCMVDIGHGTLLVIP
jgi:hypothetical protein